MIPFTDVAVAAYIKSLFLTHTVVMAPSDLSRQALARFNQNENVGIPGIAVWRIAAPKHKGYHSVPQAFEGFLGVNGPQKYDTVKFVRVKPEYSIAAWTRHLSDRDKIERILWFSDTDTYNTINVTLKGIKDQDDIPHDFTINLAFEQNDPEYRQIPDEQSGKIIWYGLEKTLTVTSQWMQTDLVSRVDEILVDFQLSNGDPIDPIIYSEVLKINSNFPPPIRVP